MVPPRECPVWHSQPSAITRVRTSVLADHGCIATDRSGALPSLSKPAMSRLNATFHAHARSHPLRRQSRLLAILHRREQRVKIEGADSRPLHEPSPTICANECRRHPVTARPGTGDWPSGRRPCERRARHDHQAGGVARWDDCYRLSLADCLTRIRGPVVTPQSSGRPSRQGGRGRPVPLCWSGPSRGETPCHWRSSGRSAR